MKRIAILYSEYVPVIDAIIAHNTAFEFQTFTTCPQNNNDFDLIIDINFEGEIKVNTLKCHYSLLPAFKTNEPVKEAFMSGVKVTGITIYYTNPQKIIAQYPIFIKPEIHFDELEAELKYLEQVLFPIVIEKILANEPINSKNLVISCDKCSGGCSRCHH